MRRALIVLGILAIGFVWLRLMGAGPADSSESPPGQTIIGRGLAAGAAVRAGASKEYFERLLTESGGDSRQQFAKDLAGLGLDGRQLQTMPIDQAYTLAHDTVMKSEDIATRRRYLLELFNETEP